MPRSAAGWEFWTVARPGPPCQHTPAFVMMMAMLALFTQEVTSIFELYYIPMLFLSGQLFPIAMLPQWAAKLAKMFPFYFTTGAPTEILIGRVQGNTVYAALGTQSWPGLQFATVLSRAPLEEGTESITPA